MAETGKKDSQDPCLNAAESKSVNFVSVLWEELSEIRELRRKRAWRCLHLNESDNSPRDAFEHEGQAAKHAEEPLPQKPKETDSQEDNDKVFAAAHQEQLVGMAFSGGGIRSATFNLGVLQGFAKFNLLPMFDYLSTVSGGGYIGGWLESWIYRARKVHGDSYAAKEEAAQAEKVAQCAEDSVAAVIASSPIRRVQECLKPSRSKKIEHGESQAIRFLREYSNYLTPRMGFLGADTWTAVAIYVRNLILNQSILILFLAFLLLLPYLAMFATEKLEHFSFGCCDLYYVAPIITALLVMVAFLGVARNLEHLTGVDRTGKFPTSAQQGWVLAYVAAPLLLAGWCLSAWISHEHFERRGAALDHWWLWLIAGAVGFWLVWLPVAFWGIVRHEDHKEFWSEPRTRVISSFCSFVSGAVGGLLLWVFADKVLNGWTRLDGRLWHVVSFGPPLVIVVVLLVVTLQLGLMGMLTPDPRREWWGRLGGWLLLMGIVWSALFGLAIYSPLAVVWSKKFVTWASVVWVLNTLIGVIGGKSDKTGSPESSSWKDAALSVTPYLFIVGLGAGLATLLEIVLGSLNQAPQLWSFLRGSPVTEKIAAWMISLNWYSGAAAAGHAEGTMILIPGSVGSGTTYISAHWNTLYAVLVSDWRLPAFAAAVLLVCLLLARRVDLNEFSMNLFYRNRLVRCYLGASHKFRRPNPFSGFDPHDDVLLSSLQSKNGYGGPFPIVNTALNLVTGENLAWQERKAESFVITPLRVGFDTWLERLDLETEAPDMQKRGIEKHGYRRAECCLCPNKFYKPGGFRLGTAISVSGAAASPNMGYHSSPSLAFLMTFFNVRLGFWTGNPRHKSAWRNAGPSFGLFRLIAELFGQSDDEARYVYLSDGGHFENLGLYELIKRRCRYIVVCDADADGDYAFGDLGGAIRKCREDIGVEITLITDAVRPQACGKDDAVKEAAANGSNRSNDKFSRSHWAIGKIHYECVDPGATPGILVYLKTSLTSDEPADVLNYHREHGNFPHQTTADQWFTESQFESYRRLGQHVVEKLLERLPLTEVVNGKAIKKSNAEIFDMFLKERGNEADSKAADCC